MDRATDYQRGLLEIFSAGAPGRLRRHPSRSPVAPFVPRPAPGEPSPEQLAEMDVLVDGLVAQWTAGPQAEPRPEANPTGGKRERHPGSHRRCLA